MSRMCNHVKGCWLCANVSNLYVPTRKLKHTYYFYCLLYGFTLSFFTSYLFLCIFLHHIFKSEILSAQKNPYFDSVRGKLPYEGLRMGQVCGPKESPLVMCWRLWLPLERVHQKHVWFSSNILHCSFVLCKACSVYFTSLPCVLFKVCSMYCTRCAVCIIQGVKYELYIKI